MIENKTVSRPNVFLNIHSSFASIGRGALFMKPSVKGLDQGVEKNAVSLWAPLHGQGDLFRCDQEYECGPCEQENKENHELLDQF